MRPPNVGRRTIAKGKHLMFRRKSIRIVVLAALGLAVAGMLSARLLTAQGNTAHASSATSVTINTVDDFSTVHPTGTFTATAPLCPSGTFIDLIISHEDPATTHSVIARTLTCDNGSGTITLDIHVQFPRQITGSAPWAINRGTGTYATLYGTGTWTTVPTGPISAADTMTGEVHFD